MTITWKHLQRRTLLKLTNTNAITKMNKCKKTEQHFYDGTQNRHEHC